MDVGSDSAAFDAAVEIANVKGLVWHVTWRSVQCADPPYCLTEALPDWTDLGNRLDTANVKSKTLVISLDLIGGGTAPGGTTTFPPEKELSLFTPPWVFSHSPPVVGVGGKQINGLTEPARYVPRLPWVNDATYKSLVEDLLLSLANYLIDPNNDRTDSVEMILLTGWEANSNTPDFYQTYIDLFGTNITPDFVAQGVLFDFDDKAVHSASSPYGTAINDLATTWENVFYYSGIQGIKLGAIIDGDFYDCSPHMLVRDYCETHGINILLKNFADHPNSANDDDPYFYYAPSQLRTYLSAWRAAASPWAIKVGVVGAAGFNSESSSTEWIAALKDFLGYHKPNPATYPGGGCFNPNTANYAALQTNTDPVANATYLVVDYAELWDTAANPCLTQLANFLCKN